jgi:hypothetical protein
MKKRILSIASIIVLDSQSFLRNRNSGQNGFRRRSHGKAKSLAKTDLSVSGARR